MKATLVRQCERNRQTQKSAKFNTNKMCKKMNSNWKNRLLEWSIAINGLQ